jgi:two-component system sensor histidine kinase UhpB
MRSALAVARQAIENGLERLPASSDSGRDLESLVGSFRGNRHLHIFITGDDGAIAVPTAELPVIADVPDWFVRLIGVGAESVHLPLVFDEMRRTVVLQTDPRNEILEVWGQFSGNFIILALFCGHATLLVAWLTRRALRPLDRLAAALQRVGRGDYSERIDGSIPPELAPLAASFNRMAAQLAEADAQNRHLNERLLSLQEDERGELARDLHDEVGPFLFAVKVDAAKVEQLAGEGRVAEIGQCVRSILDAADHMHRQVRAILGRLQPAGLSDFGLVTAVEALVAFWNRRYPGIEYRLSITPASQSLKPVEAATVYRVIQEALSNAVRHGEPKVITISVAEADGALAVRVEDDGRGIDDDTRFGFGLSGMSQRLRAIGGALECIGRGGGGMIVDARMPWSASRTSFAPAEVPA